MKTGRSHKLFWILLLVQIGGCYTTVKPPQENSAPAPAEKPSAQPSETPSISPAKETPAPTQIPPPQTPPSRRDALTQERLTPEENRALALAEFQIDFAQQTATLKPITRPRVKAGPKVQGLRPPPDESAAIDFIKINTGNFQFDFQNGIFSFDVTLVNTSTNTIASAPLRAVIDRLRPAPPIVSINNADGGSEALAGAKGNGAFFEYSGFAGGDQQLSPGETSAPRNWQFFNPQMRLFSFIVRVDGQLGGNSPPVLNAIGNQTVDLGRTLTFKLTATDPNPKDSLAFTISPLPLPANASLNAMTGVFTFRPRADQVGEIKLTFKVSDGKLQDSEAVAITVRKPSGGITAMSGRLLDTNDFVRGAQTPVVGATVSLLGTGRTATSDQNGDFLLTNIPAGSQIFDIDVTNARPAPDGSPYSGFREEVNLIDGVTNVFDRAFYLPRIARESLTPVDPTKTTTVTNPTLKTTMTVPPNTAKMGNANFTGMLSISEVPEGLAPAALPEALRPGMLITIQPVGVTFATPVPITFPNTDNLAPGTETDIWSLDAGTGVFVVVGTGRVSADGKSIDTISGGIRAADWHMTLPPGASPDGNGQNPDSQDEDKCQKCSVNSLNAVSTGSLTTDHTLVSYRALGQSLAPRLVYNSQHAGPRPIIGFKSTILSRSAVPNSISTRLKVAGVDQGAELFTSTNGLSESVDETIRQAVQFDASSFETGIYPYRLSITNNFSSSSISSVLAGDVLVNNQRMNPFGAGWTLEGLQRLIIQSNGVVVLTEGDGSTLGFRQTSGAGMALNFDGTNDYVDIPSNLRGMGIADSFTVTAWINSPASGRMQMLLEDGTQFNTDAFYLGVRPDVDGIFARLNTSRGSVWRDDIPVPSFAEKWTHLAFTYDGSSVTVYFNGTPVYQPSITGTINNGNRNLRIGFPSDENFFRGMIDELQIWKNTLDQNQILANMNQVLTGKEPGLVGYWRFDESSGQQIFDSSPNGRIGILGSSSDIDSNDPTRVVSDAPIKCQSTVCQFQSPTGDYSQLVRNADSTFTRTLKDGTRIHFNTNGYQTSIVDRNGNTTRYQYDSSNRLISITDPVGLATTLTYTNGRVATITDPAGRVTRFEHDASGNLIRIIDPDNTNVRFGYDAHHRLTTQINKRGFPTQYTYNFAGQNVIASRPDGSTIATSHSEAIGLIDTSNGLGTPSKPAPFVRPEDVQSALTDGNGNVSRFKTERFGSNVETIDPLGRRTAITRDENGNAVKIVNPNGAFTTMTYDSKGNLLTSILESSGGITSLRVPMPTARGALIAETIGDRIYVVGGNINWSGSRQFTNNEVYDPSLNSWSSATPVPDPNTWDPASAVVGKKLYLLGGWPSGNTLAREYDPTANSWHLRAPIPSGGFSWGHAAAVVNDQIYVFGGNNGSKVLRYNPDNDTWSPELAPIPINRRGLTAGVINNLIYVVGTGTNLQIYNPALNAWAQGASLPVPTNAPSVAVLNDRLVVFGGASNDPSSGGNLRTIQIYNPANNTWEQSPDLQMNRSWSAAAVHQGKAYIFGGLDLSNNATNANEVFSSTFFTGKITTSFTYEPVFNQVISIVNPNGDTTKISYDAKGNPIQLLDALKNKTTLTYNAQGLLTSTADPAGYKTIFDYDAKDNLIKTTDALGNSTTLSYDAAGNVNTSKDAEGRTTQFGYNVMNRLIRVTDALGGVTGYEYDPEGNLLEVKDAKGNLTSFEYDARNRLNATIDPLGLDEVFSYDGNGNLIATTDRNNQKIAFQYDPVNQLIRKILPGNQVTAFAYDDVGNLTRVDDPDSKLGLAYDAANRLISASTKGSPNQPEVTLTYVYDATGNRRRMIDSQTGATNYAYDALNRLTSITNPAKQTVSFEYDALSRRTKTIFPNGVTTNYAYDALSQLTNLAHALGASTISSFGYAYDKVGNRTTLNTTRTGVNVTPRLNYTYDALNRLIQATHPLPSQPNETFNYDAIGNRLRRDGQTADAAFDSTNRLLQDVQFTYRYDNNGSLIQKTEKATGKITRYTFDAENQLTQIQEFPNASLPAAKTVMYRYDGLGRRIEKNVDGVVTRYVYDLEDILLEFDGSNKFLAKYTHGPGIDESVSMERNGQSFFYHIDGLGSIVDLTNSTGAIAQAYVYNSFGQITQQVNSLVNPYSYTGREFDPESGLYFYRSRYYDSRIGRFINEDPIGIDGGDLNLYGYVLNNPVNAIDPTGEFVQAVIGAGSSVAAGWLISKLTGTCYTLQDALFDAGTGAIGVGIFNKFRKISRLSKLRNIASQSGQIRTAAQKGVEKYVGSHYAKVEIKHVGNIFKPGGGFNPQTSWIPRARVRVAPGFYADPFTGAVGPLRSRAAHIPLEALPLTETPIIGGGIGVASPASGSNCDCK